MGFGEAINTCFTKYAVFTGRAARPEYWFWVLFTLLVSIGCGLLQAALGTFGEIVGDLISLALLLPSLAVGARRLHDIDRTAWWLLIALVPVVGWIVLVVFACLPGTPGPNRFGPPPVPGQSGYRGMPA